MHIRKIFDVNTNTTSVSVGLLVMRLGICFNLFARHGLEKLTNYSGALSHFKDPIHIGPHASLLMAILSDCICSVLVALGLATRLASLYIFTMLVIIFMFVHHLEYFGAPEHVEIVVLYIVSFLSILLMGPGKYSLDAWISKRF